MNNKQEEKRKYFRDKAQEFRNKNRQTTISFPKRLASKIEADAKRYGLTLNAYCKMAILDFTSHTYQILDRKKIRKCEIELGRISSNVNQIAHKMHKHKTSLSNTSLSIQHHMNELQKLYTELLSTPINLKEEVKNTLKNDPYAIEWISDLLEQCYTQEDDT